MTSIPSNSPANHHILLVEDDLRLAAIIKEYLENNQLTVSLEHRGDDAVNTIMAGGMDLIILDLMLPGLDGLEVCRQVRNDFSGPILMLTARDDSVEQVVGLEIGADDYVTKPVEPRVLLARVRALLRHNRRTVASSATEHSHEIQYGQFCISQTSRSVFWQKKEIDCTAIEFELLWLLASHAGEILSRDFVFKNLSGHDYDGLDRSVDIRISKLRKKFEDDPTNPTRIKTIRGKGYIFVDSAWYATDTGSDND